MRLGLLAFVPLVSLLGQPVKYDQGPVDPSLKLGYITIVMKPSESQQAALEKLLEEQQNPSSPNYHRWLTPEEFGDRFGLNQSDYAEVVRWVESQGFHVENRARARNWVAFSGSAQQVQSAFHTEIHRFLVGGESHFANVTNARIPEALRKLVSGVRGLDDFLKRPASTGPEFTSSTGAHQLSPDDWATIYDVAALYNMGIDGSGQRIAIIGRSDMNQAYVDAFRSRFGLPPSTIEQHLIGPDPGVTNAAAEAALDLEWSGAVARKATIVYVYANIFNDAAQGAIDQNLAPVMSQSFGTCELESAEGYRSMAQQANAQGITWLASSGDSGGAGCDPHGFFNSTAGLTPASLGLAVALPAAYPEVTAVGGTQFNEGAGHYWNSTNTSSGASALSYIPEVVWNETGVGGLLASGGGASINFPKPSWQTGPGVPNDNARDVPDVAFSSAGNHDPYLVTNANGNTLAGGTSAASPSFAGVVALLNQYVVSSGLQPTPGLGNINPALYRLAQTAASVFHDITQGNNMVPCAANSPGCANGSLGFNAGPGYDQATGLGSVDVFNLINQWKTSSTSQGSATTTTLTINPGSITLGGTVQLTTTVTPATTVTPGVPTGTVTFTSGQTTLGTAALVNVAGVAMATMTVAGPVLPVGTATVTATYGGDATFNGSIATATVSVAAASPGSAVTISITPNPARGGELVEVSLTEEAGTGTTITGWSINGVDNFYRFVTDFGSATLPAYGRLSATFASALLLTFPASRVYLFTGVDANGRQWSQQYTLTVVAPEGLSGLALTSVPLTVPQNPSADPSCQWTQQLMLQEQAGLSVQLTRLLAGGADWSGRIQQLFGTTRLAPLGTLQASICWAGGSPPAATTYEIDGTDQIGGPVRATVLTTFAGRVGPATMSVSQPLVTLTSQSATSSVTLNLTDNTQSWRVSVFPSPLLATPWLTVSPRNGQGSQQLTLTGNPSGLATGVYNTTLVIQGPNAIPQFLEIPVVFMVGDSSVISIGGVANGASFQTGAAPGMVLSVFGTQLAASAQAASALPLPQTMAGVSATVNGIPAPLYYVSPGQLNIQIPYEMGSGTAVVGVNNNGQVASYAFTASPSAPGIFTDSAGALVPFASGKHGDTLVLFLTGEGLVSTPLATGASPFSATPLGLLPAPTLPLTVTVGGVAAVTAFAGIPPGLAGVTQVNFVIPAGAGTGLQPVVVTVGGVASQTANLTVAP
jgi:uncharacterized protein (TIGR03437 family)